MKERPIIFNSEMVRALLDGRKTQTRCVIKKQPDENTVIHFVKKVLKYDFVGPMGWETGYEVDCPYGIPGDRLWVRETWAQHYSGGRYYGGRPSYRADVGEATIGKI